MAAMWKIVVEIDVLVGHLLHHHALLGVKAAHACCCMAKIWRSYSAPSRRKPQLLSKLSCRTPTRLQLFLISNPCIALRPKQGLLPLLKPLEICLELVLGVILDTYLMVLNALE